MFVFYKRIHWLLLFLKLANCKKDLEAYIVGGEYANIADFPHVVYLFMNCRDGNWFCGGSILNQKLLLTAAHCFADCKKPSKINAFLGHHDINKVKVIREISDFSVHEKYNEQTVLNDIALGMVKGTIPLGNDMKRIIIPKKFPQVSEAQVAGWGYENDETKKETLLLKKVSQKLVSANVCQKEVNLKPGMLCATNAVKDHRPTHGDSGSALIMSSGKQIGLVSFRRPSNKDMIVYTNVTYFEPWMNTVANELYCIENL